MTALHGLYLGILLLMPIVDTILIFRQQKKTKGSHVFDRLSLFILWICVLAGLVIGWRLAAVTRCRIPLERSILVPIAVAAMLAGMMLRWAAMVTLGRFFTPHVEVASDHELVSYGIYKYIRHPGYAGIIIVVSGIGLASENWLAMMAIVLLTLAGVLNRVRVEEAILKRRFGAPYADYARCTKRFIPYVI